MEIIFVTLVIVRDFSQYIFAYVSELLN
jgi:hypothetical protein